MSKGKIKLVKQLAGKKERDRSSLFVIEGPHLIEEALKSGARVKFVLCSDQCRESVLETAESLKLETVRVEEKEFQVISGTKTPQGVLAVVEKLKNNADLVFGAKDAFVLICDGIQDPGNLGAMIRTAAAAGCTGVIISDDSVDIYNPKVVRATGGNLFRVPFIAEADVREAVKKLKSNGIAVIGTDAGARTAVYDIVLKRPFAVIIGSEGSGIKKDVLSLCGRTVNIPMAAGVESLNAAVSAAVILFEAVRQRKGLVARD